MGMFDSLHDAKGNEWQTKAFGRTLDVYRIGDPMPDIVFRRPGEPPEPYQLEVLGGSPITDGYATVRKGRLASIDTIRDEALPLVSYHGGPALP